MTFLFIDMVRVLRLRHWAQMMSTPQQLLLRAWVDEVDQAGTGDTGAEDVAWDKYPMTVVQMTLLESDV